MIQEADAHSKAEGAKEEENLCINLFTPFENVTPGIVSYMINSFFTRSVVVRDETKTLYFNHFTMPFSFEREDLPSELCDAPAKLKKEDRNKIITAQSILDEKDETELGKLFVNFMYTKLYQKIRRQFKSIIEINAKSHSLTETNFQLLKSILKEELTTLETEFGSEEVPDSAKRLAKDLFYVALVFVLKKNNSLYVKQAKHVGDGKGLDSDEEEIVDGEDVTDKDEVRFTIDNRDIEILLRDEAVIQMTTKATQELGLNEFEPASKYLFLRSVNEFGDDILNEGFRTKAFNTITQAWISDSDDSDSGDSDSGDEDSEQPAGFADYPSDPSAFGQLRPRNSKREADDSRGVPSSKKLREAEGSAESGVSGHKKREKSVESEETPKRQKVDYPNLLAGRDQKNKDGEVLYLGSSSESENEV